jgi:ribosomal protein L40E
MNSSIDKVVEARSRLIALTVAVIILAILASVAYKFPAATKIVYPSSRYDIGIPDVLRTLQGSTGGVKGLLLVGDIIRLVIWLLMAGLVLSAPSSLAIVISHYGLAAIRPKSSQEHSALMPGVTKLSTRIASLLAVAVLWPIAAKIVNTLLLMDAENQFDWVMLLVTIFFLAIILWLLYLVYQAAPPVLQAVSRGEAKIICARCHATNSPTAKFCASCGAPLAQKPLEQQGAAPTVVRCSQCGTENKYGNKFCEQCGAPLVRE